MQIKSIYQNISIVLLAMLFSCSAGAQVTFPTTNTIYTVEDGREFIQFWRGETDDFIGGVGHIFAHSDSTISFTTQDTLYRINLKGNLMSSDFVGGGLKSFDSRGNLLVYSGFSSIRDSSYQVSYYNSNSNLFKVVKAKEFSQYHYGADLRFVAKPDGGFCLMFLGNFDYNWADDDILSLYDYDKNGNLLKIIDMKDLYHRMKDSVQHLLVAEDGSFFFFGYSSNASKVASDGTFLFNFYPKWARETRAEFDKSGNLAFPSGNERNIHIYNTDGTFLKTIQLSRPDGKAKAGKFAFTKSGSIVGYSEGIVSLYYNNGRLDADIFSTKTVNRAYVDPYQGKYVEFGGKLKKDFKENIYSKGWYGNTIHKFNRDGKLLRELKLPMRYNEINDFAFSSKGNIIAGGDNSTRIFDRKGKLLLSKGFGISSGYTFSVAPNDDIYLLTTTNIYHYSPDLELIEVFYKANSPEGQLKGARHMVCGSNGLIYVLDSDSSIKIYTLKGEFLKTVSLKPKEYPGFFSLDPNHNFIVGGSLYNKKGKKIRQYYDYGNECITIGNRVFIKGYEGITSLSVARGIEKSKDTKRILGQVDLSGLDDFLCPRVYLEGSTPDGKKFYSILRPRKNGSFAFKNIPKGSSYKVWAELLYPDLNAFDQPCQQGTVGGEDVNLVFLNQPTPPDYVKIKGGVFNKIGHPIPGVKVSFADQYAMTDLYGNYVLAVAPGTESVLEATKTGYTFIKPKRALTLSNTDRLYLNFRTNQVGRKNK